MNRSRREVLIGLIGLVASSVATAADLKFSEYQLTRDDSRFKIDGFTCREATAAGRTYKLYRSQTSGPAVIVLHELPGLYHEDIDLARRVAACGFSVYMPLFFGKPGDDRPVYFGLTQTLLPWSQFPGLCPNHTSKVAGWLNALLPSIRNECQGKGVGVIGMCLTGTLPLALLGSDIVKAVVLCQPALPYLFHSSLDISRKYMNEAINSNVEILAIKFQGDGKSPDPRWNTLQKCFGKRLHEFIIHTGGESHHRRGLHSVLGKSYIEAQPESHEAFARAVAFLGHRISDPPLPDDPDYSRCSPGVTCN